MKYFYWLLLQLKELNLLRDEWTHQQRAEVDDILERLRRSKQVSCDWSRGRSAHLSLVRADHHRPGEEEAGPHPPGAEPRQRAGGGGAEIQDYGEIYLEEHIELRYILKLSRKQTQSLWRVVKGG